MKRDQGSSKEARYRIGAVAKATGVQPDTLRIWERRYGGLTPARTDAGGRLYSDADIDRLRLVKQLIDRGHSIGQIANASDGELRAMLARHDGEPAAPSAGAAAVREQFLAAVLALDMDLAQRILARASLGLPVRQLVMDLIVPILKEVGQRWSQGSLRVSHEHGVTSLMRSLLGALLATYPQPKDGPTMVLCTPTGEMHELGGLLAAVLAKAAGWQTLYLGPNLPADDILDVVIRSRAQVLALSLVTTEAPDATAELRRLLAGLPPKLTLLVGGAASDRYSFLHERAVVMTTLLELHDWLERHPVGARS